MAAKKDKSDDQQQRKRSAHKSPGGNMGAGQSGNENMGSEKPTDDETRGSQKPEKASSK